MFQHYLPYRYYPIVRLLSPNWNRTRLWNRISSMYLWNLTHLVAQSITSRTSWTSVNEGQRHRLFGEKKLRKIYVSVAIRSVDDDAEDVKAAYITFTEPNGRTYDINIDDENGRPVLGKFQTDDGRRWLFEAEHRPTTITGSRFYFSLNPWKRFHS